MTPDEARVSARVTWADPSHSDIDDTGTVVAPDEKDSAVAARYLGAGHSCVPVRWDGRRRLLIQWINPAALMLLPDEAQP